MRGRTYTIVARVDHHGATMEELIGAEVVVRVAAVAVLPDVAASNDSPQAISLKNVNPSVRKTLRKRRGVQGGSGEPSPGSDAEGPRDLRARNVIDIALRTVDRRSEV